MLSMTKIKDCSSFSHGMRKILFWRKMFYHCTILLLNIVTLANADSYNITHTILYIVTIYVKIYVLAEV